MILINQILNLFDINLNQEFYALARGELFTCAVSQKKGYMKKWIMTGY